MIALAYGHGPTCWECKELGRRAVKEIRNLEPPAGGMVQLNGTGHPAGDAILTRQGDYCSATAFRAEEVVEP